ncbi:MULTISPECIES: hypothetical protein [Mammaliicoccus]|uniref:hypothetical protein n=1 Tax=Mammaliicoccus TaxID=2803850 RepID=UPI000D1EAD18|nr:MULTISPECIES: hypothetical protein [Mammaliicoccus]PTK00441.1 hypothetical protein BUZ87_12115 [Mammaliicoccus sciuri]
MNMLLTIAGIGAVIFALLALGFWIMQLISSSGTKSFTGVTIFAVLAVICVIILIVGSNL